MQKDAHGCTGGASQCIFYTVPTSKKTAAAASPVLPYFSKETFDFLRSLKRNNRREWFEARRDVYEHALKQPMLALITRLLRGMEEYAPAHLRQPQKCLLRIYRDIRFSADKSPYKTHVSAWWLRDGLQKTSGAGYYLQVSPTEVLVAAGVYMPPKDQVLAIRRHLLEHHEEFRRLIENKKLRAKLDLHDPAALTRPPKGFAADHPAIEWIRWRQWGVTATLPAEEALKPSLPKQIEDRFRLAQPLVDFLNEPLVALAAPKKKPLFGLY